MNGRLLLWIAFALLCSCKSRKAAEPVQANYIHAITVYRDSTMVSKSIYVYSTLNCDEIRLLDTLGNYLVRLDEAVAGKDRYSCRQFGERMALMVNIARDADEKIYMTVLPAGDISMGSGACSKFFFSPVDRWKDSIPVAMWTEIDTVKQKQKLYYAELQMPWPYYKLPLLDSITVKYPAFCSKEDLEEEARGMQSMYEKNLQVDVSPNPFTESFNLVINSGRLKSSSYLNTPMTIKFYDDQGNTLLSQPVETDKPYTFSFPELPKGKVVYYRIHIGDYSLSGQVLKSR